jgi:hypothetical protein
LEAIQPLFLALRIWILWPLHQAEKIERVSKVADESKGYATQSKTYPLQLFQVVASLHSPVELYLD